MLDFKSEFGKLWRAFLGNQESPPWLRCTFDVTPDARQATTRFTIEMHIQAHFREVHGKKVPYADHRVVVTRQETDRTLKALVPRALPEILVTMLREIPPMVYEFDPRIGTTQGLEPLPLFDPPGPLPQPHFVTCRLCRRHDRTEQSMWGGGTLGWVHPTCWSR